MGFLAPILFLFSALHLPVKHDAQSYLQKFTIINLNECNLLKFLKYDVTQILCFYKCVPVFMHF